MSAQAHEPTTAEQLRADATRILRWRLIRRLTLQGALLILVAVIAIYLEGIDMGPVDNR